MQHDREPTLFPYADADVRITDNTVFRSRRQELQVERPPFAFSGDSTRYI